MVDMDTFLTTLYVIVDDFCKSHLPTEKRPGPQASLSRSEVITLAIFAQWSRFRNQRDFAQLLHLAEQAIEPRPPRFR